MRSKILHVFSQLESDRKMLLKQVAHLSPEQYNRSVNGKWSISQILTHLLTAEYLSLGYMKKKALGIDKVDNSGILENLFKLTLIKLYQYLPLRYKAPKIVIEKTPPPMAYEELVTNWDMLRADLKEFIDSVDDKNLNKKIYKNVVAGRLSIYQALVFFKGHLHHHWPQVNHLCKINR